MTMNEVKEDDINSEQTHALLYSQGQRLRDWSCDQPALHQRIVPLVQWVVIILTYSPRGTAFDVRI